MNNTFQQISYGEANLRPKYISANFLRRKKSAPKIHFNKFPTEKRICAQNGTKLEKEILFNICKIFFLVIVQPVSMF